ncbi:MAG: ABC transporter permease [Phycisphaerales bacterium]
MRKFLRNRMAVVALAVISVYVLVAGYVVLGDFFPGRAGISLKEVEEPIGPPVNIPGFLQRATPEQRVEVCRYYIDEFKRALRSRDPEQRAENLKQIHYAERVPTRIPAEELVEIREAAEEIYDRLNESEDLNRDPAMLPLVAQLEEQTGRLFAPLSGWKAVKFDLRWSLGTDRQGRSNFVRGIYSIKVALAVGLVVAFIAVLVGTLLGASAAFLGGWIDHAVVWLYSTLSSMPELVLLAVLVYAFSGTAFDQASRPWLALVPVYAAMCMEFWIGPCRVIRGEVMKIKELEYVQAVKAVGFGRMYILLRHVVPNTAHLMFINFSLLLIAAIKYEVVLSFLGLGVKVGPSWGRMIQESTPEVINGFFWQIGWATLLMFVLVLAFNIVADALQDAFDPKHVG